MKSIRHQTVPLLVTLLAALITARASAGVRLPALFAAHMVLQRDMPLKIWGWADAGENVTVSIADQNKTTTADPSGKWSVTIDPLHVGQPLTMIVKGKNTLSIQDVLVGEVWLASGQSNMTLSVGAVLNAKAEIAGSADPQLRMFSVPQRGDLNPADDVKADWKLASPDTVEQWTAVGYFFGRKLRHELGVPIGIIHSSYGGTPAEAWTSLDGISRDSDLKAQADREIQAMRQYPADFAAYPNLLQDWIARNGAADTADPGPSPQWAQPQFDDASWKRIAIPTNLEDLGFKGGAVVWFRKSFALPPDVTKKDFFMDALWLKDAGRVWFNGTELKDLVTAPPYHGEQQRYRVPAELIRPGENDVVAVRIHALSPAGGIGSRTREFKLPVAASSQPDDVWAFAVEKKFPDLTGEARNSLPHPPTAKIEHTSAGLFNAMINPLIPYGIRGVIWYQGESNAGRAYQYKKLLTLMIQDWRTRWRQGDFPFLIEQLANYNEPAPQPGESAEANLRETQLQLWQSVPNTGMAVAIDIGEVDIHPKNKQEVGRRLALVALHQVYGKDIVSSGPIYESMTIEAGQVRLKFTHTDGGLIAKGGELQRFAIAGKDKKFVWANARIDGDTVVVSSPQVPSPLAVRYAWASNPEGANLYNAAGLPASPFCTDDPPGLER